MLRKYFAAAAFMLVGVQVHAAYVWEVQDNYIDEVSISAQNPSGTAYHVLTIKLRNPISTGCSVSDTSKTVSYWSTGAVDSIPALWYSSVISAYSQGSKVDIRTDNSACNPAFGRQFMGIRLKQD